ncbi:hypothetical protein VCHENC02_5210A, partial [Vibrio harveyi]
MSFLANHNI